jgi:transposase
MERLGKEKTKRIFFDNYIPYLRQLSDVSENVLIDTTGLPNDIDFEYSQINNHNGVFSRKARLIYVGERNTTLPVYFRYVSGNIVDVVTLRVTINHLKAQGIEVKHGILDAGYCSEKNIKDLFNNNISFLIRMPNNALATKLINIHGKDVYGAEYALEYGERLLFKKRVSVKLFDHECHAYIAVDFERMSGEQEHYYRKAIKERGKAQKKTKPAKDSQFGYFVLISSEKLETSAVIPLYYMRQTIEQTFDFAKNDVALLPIRNHKDGTFRGHLLLSFMATVVLITVKRILKTRKKLATMPAIQALRAMRDIKGEVFPHALVTSSTTK